MTDTTKLYHELLEKSVYAVLRGNLQRNGLLMEETDQTVKIIGNSRISIIPKAEIIVIDLDKEGADITPEQQTELQKIKAYLEEKNRATREKIKGDNEPQFSLNNSS